MRARRIASSASSTRCRSLPSLVVALVEDQVQDAQHRAQAIGQFVVGGHGEADGRVTNALLGATDALRHGRLRYQEGARDLGGGESAHGTEGERDGRPGRERRVAAQEEQQQRVVLLRGRRVASFPAVRQPPRALDATRRCATGRSSGGWRCAPARPLAAPARRPSASGSRRPPAPPGRRPRPHRSRRSGARRRRGPAAPARAAGPQSLTPASVRPAHLQPLSVVVRGDDSINCRTWIGCSVGMPSDRARPRSCRRSRERATRNQRPRSGSPPPTP